jgi:uncharacterized RmlC-like cupin family protein
VTRTEPAGCVVVRSGDAEAGSTGLGYVVGISTENAGAQGLCLQIVRVPPGGRARAHVHADHETAVYVLAGEIVTWYGDGLGESAVTGPGDFLYIPAGMPHLPVNYGDVEAAAVIARTDPNAQEDVVLLPELDGLPHLLDPPAGA